MRNAFEKNRDITITSSKGTRYSLKIVDVLGEGANSIAYEVLDNDTEFHYILKECFPSEGATRNTDDNLAWDSIETEQTAKNRLKRACETQKVLQNSSLSVNTNTFLLEGILTGYNTEYTLFPIQNAKTYDKVEDNSLKELLKTTRSITAAVGAYHKLGYIHLDIKPQNIMIYPETREMVLLVDSDSIVSKDDFPKNSTFSFTQGYASPELTAGLLTHINESADIYSIGAILFQRIFGRVPNSDDRSLFSNWDLTDNVLFANQPENVKNLTVQVLHKSLAASPKARYHSTAELEDALDEVIDELEEIKKVIIKDRKSVYAIISIIFFALMVSIVSISIRNYKNKWNGEYVFSYCFGEFNSPSKIEATVSSASLEIDAIKKSAILRYPGVEKNVPLQIQGETLTLTDSSGINRIGYRRDDGIITIPLISDSEPFSLSLIKKEEYDAYSQIWEGAYKASPLIQDNDLSWYYDGETEFLFFVNLDRRLLIFADVANDKSWLGCITDFDEKHLHYFYYYDPTVISTCESLGQAGFDVNNQFALEDGNIGTLKMRAFFLGPRTNEDPGFAEIWEEMDQMLFDSYLSLF